MRLLTLARDLTRRKARERHGLFVVEGVRAVEAALAADVAVRGALVAPALLATPRGATVRAALDAHVVDVLEVDDAAFASAADTGTPQGVLLIAERPAASLDALAAAARGPSDECRFLVLDAVQDPGNVGTLVRAAAALGATGVVALPGTADLWSAKVVRAGMGAHFALPVLHAPLDALGAMLVAADVPLWGADGAGEPVDTAAERAPTRLALVVGNEGAGLGTAVRAAAVALVRVPSTGRVESLNAAVAGSILLYALRPAALRGQDGPPLAPG
ncbi:rRNA methyltransferase [Gemmatimonadetes bacterium T265]|nr:rRNA methyltransferase [Gemmatimonadetes bacterium T265]